MGVQKMSAAEEAAAVKVQALEMEADLTEKLGGDATPVKQGSLSVFGATMTMSQNILGAGVLGFPFAIEAAGVVGGFGVMAAAYLLSFLTMSLLVLLCNHTGQFTYKGLCKELLGGVWPVLSEVWVLLYNLGCCIAYVILLGDFIHMIGEYFGTAWATKELGMIVATMGVALPLSCAPSLGFLKYMSMLGITGVLFVMVAVLKRYSDGSYHTDASGNLVMVKWNTFGACFPVMAVGYGCHFNVPTLYRELAPGAGSLEYGSAPGGRADLRRMQSVILGALTISSVVFATVGLVVYYMFGHLTHSDFSENFRADDEWLVVVRVMLTLALSGCYPLVMSSARNAIFKIFLEPYSWVMTTGLRVTITSALTVGCLVLALVAGDIGVVLQYNGSVFGSPVCYVAPAVLYLCLPKEKHATSKFWAAAAIFSAVLGSAFAALGVYVVATASEENFHEH